MIKGKFPGKEIENTSGLRMEDYVVQLF